MIARFEKKKYWVRPASYQLPLSTSLYLLFPHDFRGHSITLTWHLLLAYKSQPNSLAHRCMDSLSKIQSSNSIFLGRKYPPPVLIQKSRGRHFGCHGCIPFCCWIRNQKERFFFKVFWCYLYFLGFVFLFFFLRVERLRSGCVTFKTLIFATVVKFRVFVADCCL